MRISPRVAALTSGMVGKREIMSSNYRNRLTMDSSDFVQVADLVPGVIQEIRYYSTYNFTGQLKVLKV